MERIAIPVFESRVSPVLDSCRRIVLIDIDDGQEVNRSEILLEKLSLMERLDMLSRWGIKKIICAGVSDTMCKFLAGQNILLVTGIAGEIERIINAYICNRLDNDCYSMPGKQRQQDP
jgi:predicted Fe-Mo cluster-binding NifX family protein